MNTDRTLPCIVDVGYKFSEKTTMHELIEETFLVLGSARALIEDRLDNTGKEADWGALYLLRHVEALVTETMERQRAIDRAEDEAAERTFAFSAPFPAAVDKVQDPDALAHGAAAAQQMLRDARTSYLESGFEIGNEFEGVAAHAIFPALSDSMVELMSSENYRYGFSLGLSYHLKNWFQRVRTADSLRRNVINALVANKSISPPATASAELEAAEEVAA